MSIPNPFRPVCGSNTKELPYVQPIMTSATTWSNITGDGAASFGLHVENEQHETEVTRGPAYQALDGRRDTCWLSGIGAMYAMELHFLKKLKISKIIVGNTVSESDRTISGSIYAEVGGQFELLGDYSYPVLGEAQILLPEPVETERLKFTMKSTVGFGRMSKIILYATYKS